MLTLHLVLSYRADVLRARREAFLRCWDGPPFFGDEVIQRALRICAVAAVCVAFLAYVPGAFWEWFSFFDGTLFLHVCCLALVYGRAAAAAIVRVL